jgi:hypothetical protein
MDRVALQRSMRAVIGFFPLLEGVPTCPSAFLQVLLPGDKVTHLDSTPDRPADFPSKSR